MPKNHPDYQVFSLDEFKSFIVESRFGRVVRTIINEHSAPFNHSMFDPKIKMQLLLNMDMYQRKYGYSSLCYHVVVFPDGTVGYCRPIDDIPGGFVKDNSYDIIVCSFGDFSEGADKLTIEQEKAVVEINALLCRKFSLTPNSESITYACWYNLVTGEMDGGGDPAIHKNSPGINFFLGTAVDDAELGFIKLVKLKYKINKIEPHEQIDSNGKMKIVVTSDSLRIRNLPSADGETIGKFERGTVLSVYDTLDRWYKVDGFEERWISGRFADVLGSKIEN